MARPRISGGRARGRVLPAEVPPSARPTSSRVREALFSLVGHDLEGLTVLDAFGGSGLLALEAWSRGAQVTVVERDRAALRRILENVRALGAEVRVVAGDVLRLASTLGAFDGVLVDPPYAMSPGPVVAALAPLARSWLVLETDADTDPPDIEVLPLDRRRVYGGTALAVYRRGAD